MNREFKQHYLFKHKKIKLIWSFDTFRTKRGWDKFYCNLLRLIGIFGLTAMFYANWHLIFKFPLIAIYMFLAGMTKVVWAQNNYKRFTFEAW
jgi:hypothetical protein